MANGTNISSREQTEWLAQKVEELLHEEGFLFLTIDDETLMNTRKRLLVMLKASLYDIVLHQRHEHDWYEKAEKGKTQ